MEYIYNTQSKQLRKKLRKNQTDAESIIWSKLKSKQINGLKFYRQFGIGKYVIDFFCPSIKLAIEIDGGQHNEEKIKLDDEQRSKFLEDNEIKVIRFWNNEIIKNLEGVYEKILDVTGK